MVNLGLCVGKDLLCSRIGHPLSYYEAKNEARKPAGLRLKRLTDFLTRYFLEKGQMLVGDALKDRDEARVRSHLREELKRSPLFRPGPPAPQPGTEKTAAAKEKPLPVSSLQQMKPGRWYRVQLGLVPVAKSRKGLIRRLKVNKGVKEYHMLYSEFKGMDRTGTRAVILPILDIALAMTLLGQKEQRINVVCCALSLFGRRFLSIVSLYRDEKKGEEKKK